MNFTEAMNLVYENPAGPESRAVKRKSENTFIFYDKTLFLGICPFGFRVMRVSESAGTESNIYSPKIEDINATDWEEFIPPSE